MEAVRLALQLADWEAIIQLGKRGGGGECYQEDGYQED
jgi:hypothetical protein